MNTCKNLFTLKPFNYVCAVVVVVKDGLSDGHFVCTCALFKKKTCHFFSQEKYASLDIYFPFCFALFLSLHFFPLS